MERDYFITSLLTVALIPWTEFIFWYIGPMIWGEIVWVWLEVVYSTIIVYLMGIWTGFLEINIEISYKKLGKILIIVFFALSVVIFTGFSFVKPYIDVFYGIYNPTP